MSHADLDIPPGSILAKSSQWREKFFMDVVIDVAAQPDAAQSVAHPHCTLVLVQRKRASLQLQWLQFRSLFCAVCLCLGSVLSQPQLQRPSEQTCTQLLECVAVCRKREEEALLLHLQALRDSWWDTISYGPEANPDSR